MPPVDFRLLRQLTAIAFLRALFRAGSNIPARMAMITILQNGLVS